MYPIRVSRALQGFPFLRKHVCDELCNASYQITSGSVTISYQSECMYPSEVEPAFYHISDDISEYNTQCFIPQTITMIIDYPLRNPVRIQHIFDTNEIFLGTILKVFDMYYRGIYEEEEKKSTQKYFTLEKNCPDCNDSTYFCIDNSITANTVSGGECGICFEGKEDMILLNSCNHIYHKNCILKWFNTRPSGDNRNCNKSNSCPLCRTPIILCSTCKSSRLVREIYHGSSIPYSENLEHNRNETDGPYRIHTLHYEELYFKGVVYNRNERTLRLLPEISVD